ncbi:hypothetical protein VPH35_105148 [Triticum aestivum]
MRLSPSAAVRLPTPAVARLLPRPPRASDPWPRRASDPWPRRASPHPAPCATMQSVLADLLWPFNFGSSGRSASGARRRAPRSRLCVEFRASSTAVCCSLLFSTECAAMCGFTLDSSR